MVRAPTKQDFKPNKTHGFTFAIFLAGCLLPPIGESDCTILTVCREVTRVRESDEDKDEG